MHRWIRNPKAPSSLWDGLVLDGAYAGLHPGTNRFVDGSGLENHGTLTNMDAASDWVWSDELGRWALDFDGTNDYIQLPSATLTFGAGWTFGCWAQFDSSTNRSLFGDGASYSRWVLTDNRTFYVSGSTNKFLSFRPTSPVANWNHYLLSSDNKCWMNGSVAYTYTGGDSQFVLQHIGRGYTLYWMDGRESDFCRWSRNLAPKEITWLANRSNRMYVPDTRRAIWVPTPFNPALMRRRRRMAGAR